MVKKRLLFETLNLADYSAPQLQRLVHQLRNEVQEAIESLQRITGNSWLLGIGEHNQDVFYIPAELVTHVIKTHLVPALKAR